MMKWIIIAGLLASGCATTQSKMNSISLGMTKQEVIHAIGAPDSTRAGGHEEILVYNPNFWHATEGWTVAKYLVVLTDGKVASYGNENYLQRRRAPAVDSRPVFIDNEPPPGMPGSPLYMAPIAPINVPAPSYVRPPSTTRCHQEPGALGRDMVCESN